MHRWPPNRSMPWLTQKVSFPNLAMESPPSKIFELTELNEQDQAWEDLCAQLRLLYAPWHCCGTNLLWPSTTVWPVSLLTTFMFFHVDYLSFTTSHLGASLSFNNFHVHSYWFPFTTSHLEALLSLTTRYRYRDGSSCDTSQQPSGALCQRRKYPSDCLLIEKVIDTQTHSYSVWAELFSIVVQRFSFFSSLLFYLLSLFSFDRSILLISNV